MDTRAQFTAGCRLVEVADAVAPVPLLLLYPAHEAEQPQRLGQYTLSAAPGAVPAAGAFPVVLVSHGTGGRNLVYRGLACELARRGFVVGLPLHPGNHRDDNALADTVQNLRERPRHLALALDWILASADFAHCLRPEAVAVIGHSLGGYTALALAGGVPTSLAEEAADGKELQLEVVHDARVRALVLLAPATVWFRYPGALRVVDLPILMRIGNRDPLTPAGFHGAVVLSGVADAAKVDYQLVENAGHFAFQTPFPPELCVPGFMPAQDPPGFDRAAYEGVLVEEVVGFLGKVFGSCGGVRG